MTQPGYKQFCPVAMAAEVLCTRWTLVLLRELIAGSTRFNDLRRGVPKMSPTLLSQRLKDLEQAGIVERRPVRSEKGIFEYTLTPAGRDLGAVVEAVGFWGQKWVESTLSLKNLDPSLLMWDMRRNLDPRPLPPRRCTIKFQFPELVPARRCWWLVVEGATVDLCGFDPGFEVDVLVTASLRSMTAIWMGLAKLGRETAEGRVRIDGDPAMARDMGRWLRLSSFAAGDRRVA